MNIINARNQLHQISKHNPQVSQITPFDINLYCNQNLMNQKFRNHRTFKKTTNQSHPEYHPLNQQYQHLIEQNHKQKKKNQYKIPVFINQKSQKFQSQQKQRFHKLGLQDFLMNINLNHQNNKNSQHAQQKIIKNLNNTYFRTTDHIFAKKKNMVNTLGIKKGSISDYKVDWNNKDFEEIELEWREIGYISNKVFPCRKNSSIKSKIYTPRKEQQNKRLQRNKLSNKNFKNKIPFTDYKSQNLKNQNFNKTQSLNKLNAINSPSQLFKNKQIRLVVEKNVHNIIHPRKENRKRPSTCRDLIRKPNREGENSYGDFTQKGYSQYLQSSSNFFNENNVKSKRKMSVEYGQRQYRLTQRQSNDFIVGRKMQIHI